MHLCQCSCNSSREWGSRLENIFLALLFDADNRTLYGNFRAFKPFADELVFLETEGIVVKTLDCGEVRLYFVLSAILRDNKGLNGVCGFVESFSANFYCRICSDPKEMCQYMYKEDPEYLRTHESYMADVRNNDYRTTGDKELNIFDRVPTFESAIRNICR